MENMAILYILRNGWASLEVLPVQSYIIQGCVILVFHKYLDMSLLSCISATSNTQLLELGLQLHLGDSHLILLKAQSQLRSLKMAHHLYL